MGRKESILIKIAIEKKLFRHSGRLMDGFEYIIST